MAEYRDETNIYVDWNVLQTMSPDTSKINSGDVLKEIVSSGIVADITADDVNIDIEEILPEIKKSDKEFVVVYKGELCYASSKNVSNNENQVKWCKDLGIKILEFTEPEGIVVKNGKYELVNGIYLCTPKLDDGFVSEKTRYLELGSNDHLTPGNWITSNPTENWYDYKNSKWANIYIENEGSEIYYVWIPRYCFKLDQTNQKSDVKFIDVDNNYKDAENSNNDKTWEQLETEGYQVPEAFEFNGTNLAGYWAMKYTAGDITKPSTINFDMSVSKGNITIKNITLNASITASNPITKYTIALNGNIERTITDVENITSQLIEFKTYKAGNNTINVTGLNANDEIVGSMTKEYSPAIVNKPELSQFNQETTFYVTYDENGNEHSTTPISKEMPQYWYEYGESRWANIVTRNNGQEIYYVWIPRYSFKLDQTNQKSTIKFLSGTSTQTDAGYQIPEAFTFNGQELTGYWAMKYTAGDEHAPRFDTEVVATNNSIRTKGITGTEIGENKQYKYKYYINGDYKGEKNSSGDNFEYTGLSSGTKYTILVEIRDNEDKYIGSIVKQISTIEPNKPDLTGFKEEYTHYVTYDEEGNETIGNTIKNDGSNAPEGWYDYSKSRWANIVVQANDKKVYYVWIPRYEFMITSAQQKQPAIGRTEVRFIKDTSTDTDSGYQIPEAFKFNGKELTGYWAMKYTAGD